MHSDGWVFLLLGLFAAVLWALAEVRWQARVFRALGSVPKRPAWTTLLEYAAVLAIGAAFALLTGFLEVVR